MRYESTNLFLQLLLHVAMMIVHTSINFNPGVPALPVHTSDAAKNIPGHMASPLELLDMEDNIENYGR
jgi:hypothetical protein